MNKLKLLLIIMLSSILYSESSGYAKNGDVNIFYVDYGPKDATPVLLVQGLGGQLTFWPKEFIQIFKASQEHSDFNNIKTVRLYASEKLDLHQY